MRKRFSLLFALFVALSLQAQESPRFSDWFADSTLRMDYLRVGSSHRDTALLQRFVLQNTLWAGSRTQLLDPVDNGSYRLWVEDAASGRPLYSRTFNTLFQEYRETAVGRDSTARFEEVALMPFPRKAVRVCLQKRDSNQHFYSAESFLFDPARQQVEQIISPVKPVTLLHNGDPHTHIDVVIVAEGYGRKDAKKMAADLEKFKEYLLAQEPFKGRRADFNVWGVGKLARKSGVTDPNKNRYVESAVGSSYNTFGSDRYLMTMQLFQLHDLLAGCPYDHIVIMANCGTYGGGAIYNFYAFSAVQEMSMWILPHELGHSIGGLADEYVDEELSYNDIHKAHQEPVEPNITNLVDFASKWQDLVPEGTPVPTPPVKGLGPRDCGPVGLYEGAGYQKEGLYRPCTNCMMKYYAAFCPVCYRTLNRMFDLYVR